MQRDYDNGGIATADRPDADTREVPDASPGSRRWLPWVIGAIALLVFGFFVWAATSEDPEDTVDIGDPLDSELREFPGETGDDPSGIDDANDEVGVVIRDEDQGFLPLPESRNLAPFVGNTVEARNVAVLEPADDYGFWVGDDLEDERVFVWIPLELRPDVPDLDEGSRVSFDAVVRPVTPDIREAIEKAVIDDEALPTGDDLHYLHVLRIAVVAPDVP